MSDQPRNGDRAIAGLALLQEIAAITDKGLKKGQRGATKDRINALQLEEVKNIAAAIEFASIIGNLIALRPTQGQVPPHVS